MFEKKCLYILVVIWSFMNARCGWSASCLNGKQTFVLYGTLAQTNTRARVYIYIYIYIFIYASKLIVLQVKDRDSNDVE